ncbi:MAG: hypothetical protein LBK28_02585 [Propionibacteriaceae bacterium]|nr:hypothetical protein [Propionibacteriaceae bacterium]
MARDDEGKRPFLIGYDYGMGGLWGVMYARSTEEIKDHYPELVVVNEWPKWMDNDEFTRMAENAYDIDGPP